MEKISFNYYLYKAKTRADGKVPIYGRITYKKSRKNFSTGIFIKPYNWISQSRRVRSQPEITLLLSKVYIDIQKEIIKASITDSYNVDDIYNSVFSTKKENTLLDGVKGFIEHVKSLIGIDYRESTYLKYRYMYTQIEDYLKYSKKGVDYKPSLIDIKYLHDLEYYYKTVKLYNDRTTHKNMQRFRTLVGYLLKEEIIDKNPFNNYQFPKVKKHIIYLTVDELKRLEELIIDDERLESIRKLLIFLTYTGMGYSEYKNFKEEDIDTSKGIAYINIKRVKTDSSYIVPLLPQAKSILEYFNYNIPKISNQKMNKNLKVILTLIGVKKNMTLHSLRKSFASTVLLNSGIPLDVTSQLLGHKSLNATKDYAEFNKDYLLEQFKENV